MNPQTVNFGMRFETTRGRTKIVYDSFEYVSVQQTITSLLNNEHFIRSLQKMQQESSCPDVIGQYNDGEQAKRSAAMNRNNSNTLRINLQLFYDGMGTTNPLWGQSVMCNVGVFYYVIQKLA